jgi:TPR repeat protein
MKKLLCLLLVSIVASVGWTQVRVPPNKGKPRQDYSVHGVLEQKSKNGSVWTLVLDGKPFTFSLQHGVGSLKPAKITRAGLPATIEDSVVGDYVVVIINGPLQGTFAKEASFSPALSATAPPGKDEAAKKKAAADAATLKFYQERAEKGDAVGQYRMGIRYLKGDGVPKDLDKARESLSKAAAQGNQDAAAELAKLSAPELPVQTNSPPKKGEDR